MLYSKLLTVCSKIWDWEFMIPENFHGHLYFYSNLNWARCMLGIFKVLLFGLLYFIWEYKHLVIKILMLEFGKGKKSSFCFFVSLLTFRVFLKDLSGLLLYVDWHLWGWFILFSNVDQVSELKNRTGKTTRTLCKVLSTSCIINDPIADWAIDG